MLCVSEKKKSNYVYEGFWDKFPKRQMDLNKSHLTDNSSHKPKLNK